MTRKIYVVGYGRNYANWMEGEIVSDLEDADLVVFTGGEDINPGLYNAQVHPMTYFNRFRDEREIEAYHQARNLKKKLIGICRGAQFLCAMAGGSLVQHQAHPWRHPMETRNGRIQVTSTHHQRQYPWGNKKPKVEILGWCNNLSPYSEGETRTQNLNGRREVEIAFYPDIDALAVQPHPEAAYPMVQDWEKEFIGFCRETLNGLMSSKVKEVT